MSTKPFYNHIAGLRGIAIILVFLFHLCTASFPHGYYGVDIFLVISGYLLFLSFNRNGNQLSLKDFAVKKLLRLFPPMTLAVLLTIIASLAILDSDEIVNLSKIGRYTVLGFANSILSKSQTDYFATDALNNPLLHMWYLGVTIQLYVIFAAGCIAYRFLPRKLSWYLLWIAGIGSFCYGYSYQIHNLLQAMNLPAWEQLTPVSHYHTMPRIWEPLAGGAILLLPLTCNKLKATLLTAAGLAATILPAIITSGVADYGAPLVVLGTMLIIRYMPESRLMPVLSNRLLIWVGGISFSFYLVHMPVISYFNSWYQGINGWQDYAIITLLSLVLAYAFWFLIEKRRINLWGTIALWGISLGFCILAKEKDGFKDYVYPEINKIRIAPYDDWQFCKDDVLNNHLDKEALVYNSGVLHLTYTTRKKPRNPSTLLMQLGPESQEPRILLIGDSHAQAAYAGMNQLCHELNIPGVCLSSIILPNWDMDYYLNSTYFYNQKKAEAFIKWLAATPSITHVFIGQYWRYHPLIDEHFIHWDSTKEPMTMELYSASLREFINRVKALGKHVVLIGPAPEIKNPNPSRFIRQQARRRNTDMNLETLSCSRAQLAERTKEVMPMLEQLEKEGLCTLLKTIQLIPENEPFVAYQNSQFLMTDAHHLSGQGSVKFFQLLKPQIHELFNKKNDTTPECPH